MQRGCSTWHSTRPNGILSQWVELFSVTSPNTRHLQNQVWRKPSCWGTKQATRGHYFKSRAIRRCSSNRPSPLATPLVMTSQPLDPARNPDESAADPTRTAKWECRAFCAANVFIFSGVKCADNNTCCTGKSVCGTSRAQVELCEQWMRQVSLMKLLHSEFQWTWNKRERQFIQNWKYLHFYQHC